MYISFYKIYRGSSQNDKPIIPKLRSAHTKVSPNRNIPLQGVDQFFLSIICQNIFGSQLCNRGMKYFPTLDWQ